MDWTVMGPLDQARIWSRTFPAGRPHQARTTDNAEETAGKLGRWLEGSGLVCWGSLDHYSLLTFGNERAVFKVNCRVSPSHRRKPTARADRLG